MRRARLARLVAATAWICAFAAVSGAQSPARTTTITAQAPARLGIGRAATPAEIAAWDIDIMPDGTGLPPGRGTPAEGAQMFASRCAACHGRTGREGPNDILVGREPGDTFAFSQNGALPHTIGNYWPYATTVFDYIRRAMPPDAPRSLSDTEVYSLTAFLLHANGLIAADAVIDAASLPGVSMPARKHFVPDTRPQAAPRR